MRTFLLLVAVAIFVIGSSAKSAHKSRDSAKEAHMQKAKMTKMMMAAKVHEQVARQVLNGTGSTGPPMNGTGPSPTGYYWQEDPHVFETCQGGEGEITSPNYPAEYPNNYNCNRTIEIPKDKVVVITVEQMDIEVGSDCVWDALTISTADDSKKICGDSTEVACTYVARGDKVTVSFRTDGSVTFQGFRVTYTIEDDDQQQTDGCVQPCAPWEIPCGDGSGQCMNQWGLCDNWNDCDSGIDEAGDCPGCNSDQIPCDDGSNRCIFPNWICDGWADCVSGMDEEDCPAGTYPHNNSTGYPGMTTPGPY